MEKNDERCKNCSERCPECGRRAPVLTGEEEALLRDIGALTDMRLDAENLGFDAAGLALRRQNGEPVERVQVLALLRLQLEPINGQEIVNLTNISLTPLEQQLLLDRGVLHVPSQEDTAKIQEIMQEAFDNTAVVFEFERLGPLAFECYMQRVVDAMLEDAAMPGSGV